MKPLHTLSSAKGLILALLTLCSLAPSAQAVDGYEPVSDADISLSQARGLWDRVTSTYQAQVTVTNASAAPKDGAFRLEVASSNLTPLNPDGSSDPGGLPYYDLTFTALPPGNTTYVIYFGGRGRLSYTVALAIKPVGANVAPTAATDNLTATGNTQKTFAAPGVLANDSDAETPGSLSVTAGLITTANGGSANMNADGSFTYTPPVGFVSDSFSYTLNDNDPVNPLSSTGTVNISMSDVVWYVDDSAGAGGNGTSAAPFNTLAEGVTAASPSDIVFVYAGSYTGGVTLADSVQLIGEGSGLNVDGLTVPAGTAPSISAGAGIDIITVANGNTVAGVTLAGGRNGIRGGAGIMGLTVDNVTLSETGANSIQLLAPVGTVTISNSTISALLTNVNGLDIDNNGLTGTQTLNVSDSSFTGRGDLTGMGLQTAVDIDNSAATTGVIHASFTGNTFTGTYFDGIELQINGITGGDTVTIGDGVSPNVFTGMGAHVLDLRAGDNTDTSYTIRGNTLDGNGLSVGHGINLQLLDNATTNVTIADNSFTDIGNDTNFNNSLNDDAVVRLVLGNSASAFSNATLSITGNSLTSNNARGVTIDVFGVTTVGATVNDNVFGGHLGNNGLDVLTTTAGTSVCLAASGNSRTVADVIDLEEDPGSTLNVTGAASAAAMTANNNGMPVTVTGAVAFGSGCSPL